VTNPIPSLIRQARVQVGTGQSDTGLALAQRWRQPTDGKREGCLCRGGSDGELDTVLISQALGDVAGHRHRSSD